MHPGQRALIAQLAKEDAAWWAEERAAILEFDAGLTREEAEAEVRRLALRKPVEQATLFG